MNDYMYKYVGINKNVIRITEGNGQIGNKQTQESSLILRRLVRKLDETGHAYT